MDPSSITISGPLALHLRGLWDHLMSHGYTPLSAANIARCMAHFSRWLAERGVAPRSLRTEQIDSFLRHRRRHMHVGHISRRGLQPILDYLIHAEAVRLIGKPKLKAAPTERIQREYSEYLIKERCIGESTRKFYLKVAGEFLGNRVDAKGRLGSLTAADLSAFTLTKFKNLRVRYCQCYVAALRSLLRYLFMRGKISVDISTAVPSVATCRMSSLPKALVEEEVERLLSGCDRRTRNGRLSYAVLLIMVRLGLRACEVGALQLEDIRWRQGEIVVHGKGGQEDVLPLPKDVGQGLAAYIRRSRSRSQIRAVFMSTRAPRKALGSKGVKSLVASAFRRVGISPTGAHRLRHTAATEMLRHGVPLPEIAQVLRHRHIDTTAIYAKVDRASLRTLAVAWPEVRHE